MKSVSVFSFRRSPALLLRSTGVRQFQQTAAHTDDTIYALSSGAASKCGVAVFRISGPATKFCLELLTNGTKFPEPKRMSLRRIRCPDSGALVDRGMVLWCPQPNSFTGEDVGELHVHGGAAVIKGLMKAFEDLNSRRRNSNIRGSIRPAEAGEFTRRAFENGKMDLTEVEGLADLLVAETDLQRVQALSQMEGKLRIAFENWRHQLIKYLAHMEAVIDFGDDDREDDVTDVAYTNLFPKIRDLVSELTEYLNRGRRNEIIRDGFRIVIAGPPNAGKSSLLNAMIKRPVAIVSPEPGTTRDLIEVKLDIGGMCCILTDTAGLRSNTDIDSGLYPVGHVELEGMRRARDAIRDSDLKIFMCDVADNASVLSMKNMIQRDIDQGSNAFKNNIIVVHNKVDELVNYQHFLNKDNHTFDGGKILCAPVSCKKGTGLENLEALIRDKISECLQIDTKGAAVQDKIHGITRQRHRFHVEQCIHHLKIFLNENDAYEFQLPIDAKAEELRLASNELGKVTGRVDVEELLDVIFRDFCIGK